MHVVLAYVGGLTYTDQTSTSLYHSRFELGKRSKYNFPDPRYMIYTRCLWWLENEVCRGNKFLVKYISFLISPTQQNTPLFTNMKDCPANIRKSALSYTFQIIITMAKIGTKVGRNKVSMRNCRQQKQKKSERSLLVGFPSRPSLIKSLLWLHSSTRWRRTSPPSWGCEEEPTSPTRQSDANTKYVRSLYAGRFKGKDDSLACNEMMM